MMKIIQLHLLSTVFVLYNISVAGTDIEIAKPKSFIVQRGEILTYEVRWLAIKIGEIKIFVMPDNELSSTYHAEAHINSAEGLPFADVHAVIKSVLTPQSVPLLSTSWEKQSDNSWSVLHYQYDDQRTRAVIKKGKSVSKNSDSIQFTLGDTLRIDSMTQDGFSIFFFARQHLTSGDTFSVKTIVQGSAGSALMRFYSKQTNVRIKAVEYPIDVVEFDGIAKFKGIFGLTGDFKGWFSNDEARVPIKAKLGVLLGNVDIELVSWNRKEWKPPLVR